MKKIKSVVASSASLVDDLKSIGLFAQASVIDQAINASSKIKTVLRDEGVGDNEEQDIDLDLDEDDLEDVLEDEGVGDIDDADEDESENLPDDAIGVDTNSKYSPKQLKKLKSIAKTCIDSNKSVKSAKALLMSIANYEASL